MKVGWIEAELGDLFDITSSKRVTQSEWTEKGVPFYRAREIVKLAETGRVDNELFISEELYEKHRKNHGVPRAGDMMVTGVGTLGACHVVNSDERFYFKDASVLWFKSKGRADPRFVKYAFRSEGVRRQLSEGIGATVGTYTISRANSTKIPLPPLEEQRRIVALLDEVSEGLARARSHAEANLRNARELFANSLIAVFEEAERDAEELTLANASIDFGRGRSRHRPRNAPFLYGGKYPFIQTGDIRNSDGTVSSFTQTYNEEGLAQSKLWPAGTICITIAANIAETAVLGFDACFPDSIIGMVADPDITFPEYVEFMLRYFAADLKAKGKGSAQDNINLGTFEVAKFPFPAMKKQRDVVEKLTILANEVAVLTAAYLAKRQDIDSLRQSILERAFAGELTQER